MLLRWSWNSSLKLEKSNISKSVAVLYRPGDGFKHPRLFHDHCTVHITPISLTGILVNANISNRMVNESTGQHLQWQRRGHPLSQPKSHFSVQSGKMVPPVWVQVSTRRSVILALIVSQKSVVRSLKYNRNKLKCIHEISDLTHTLNTSHCFLSLMITWEVTTVTNPQLSERIMAIMTQREELSVRTQWPTWRCWTLRVCVTRLIPQPWFPSP